MGFVTAPQYILPDKTPNFLDFSHQQLFRQATGYVCPNSWSQAAAQAASPQLCCCSRAAGNAAFSSDSIRLTLLPTCAHWTLLLTSDKSLPWKFADLFTFCQKKQFWRNISPSLPNVSRPLTPAITVRVARARARRSQLVKQIGTQPARDCQTES